MKRKLTYLAAALLITSASVVSLSFGTARAAVESCQGKCHRAYQACVNTGTNPPSCNASYQGCISSCK